MIYVIDDEFCYTILEGPKMKEEKLIKLIKKYQEKFYEIFTAIYDYFGNKYRIHEVLMTILNLKDNQHLSFAKYEDIYVQQMLQNEHNFTKNLEYEVIEIPCDCGCC